MFAREIAELPKLPDRLQNDIGKNWHYESKNGPNNGGPSDSSIVSDTEQKEELDQFEADVKGFMYEGVSVQRIILGASGKGQYCLERRTLWLMLPELGSMRVGLLSKSTDESGVGKDECDVYSRGRSLGSAMSNDDDGSVGSSTDRSSLVEGNLSRKFSMNLADVVSIERCPMMNNVINSANIDSSRLIKIESRDGKVLLFITNNISEAEVIFSGLKLLVEKETHYDIDIRSVNADDESEFQNDQIPETPDRKTTAPHQKDLGNDLPYNEQSGIGDESLVLSSFFKEESSQVPVQPTNFEEHSFAINASHASVSHTSHSHGSISSYDNSGEFEDSSQRERHNLRYVQGQVIHTQIATNISVSLPLQLCRALLLDSTSPLMKHWELGRGDFNFSYGDWVLKDSMSPRSVNYPDLQEFELIAKGNMSGASRSTSFERIRKGQRMSLSETWFVDLDEKDKFVFNILENMPRRGFSLRVRVAVRPSGLKNSDVTVVGEVVPLGRNTSNQAVVHRAFLLVLKELQNRYSVKDEGLLGVLLKINPPSTIEPKKQSLQTTHSTKKMHKKNEDFQYASNHQFQETTSSPDQWVQFDNNSNGNVFNTRFHTTSPEINDEDGQSEQPIPQDPNEEKVVPQTPQRKQKMKKETDRPPTPSMKQRMKNEIESEKSKINPIINSLNHDFVQPEQTVSNPIKIDVKPLPKIRLDLMPSPREADEEFEDDW